MLEVKLTDKVFYDSPDSGHPDCLCSRCEKPIPEHDVVVRCWPTVATDYGFDPKAKSGTEFRYCNKCCEGMGMIFSKSDYDDNELSGGTYGEY